MEQFLPITSSFMILIYFRSEKYYKELCHSFNKVKSSIKVKYLDSHGGRHNSEIGLVCVAKTCSRGI